MLVQDFLRYRKRFRVGITPLSAETYPTLTGWPENLVHETDLYQSIIPYLEGQNADGAVFSLTGERLEEALTITEGHSHNTAKTALPWVPIAACQFPANRSDYPTAAVVTTDTDFSSLLGVMMGTVQEGTTEVLIRACATGPFGAGSAASFQLTFLIYGDDDFLGTEIVTQLVWGLGATHDEAWLETAPIDISGLDFTADRQLIVLVLWSFNVLVGAPEMAVHGAVIGAVP